MSRSNGLINRITLFSLILLASLVGLPAAAYAAVQITEIMYDVADGDSGREWVEITNTGTEPVDIAKFKLTEGTTNHGFTAASGGTLLAPGSSAILADDPAKFTADWPTYAGVLLNTTFSLSNTGETLTIKNASAGIEDSVSYTASLGAAGDKGSLQRSGANFVAALPSPGVFPGTFTPVQKIVKAALVKASSISKSTSITKAKIPKVSKRSLTAAVAAPENTFDMENQPDEPSVPLALWIAGLVALISLGATGAVYARLNRLGAGKEAETNHQTEEFQIVES